jgi:hypothetical protein
MKHVPMGLAATLWGVKKQSLAGLELLAAAPQPACAVPSRQCSGHGKGAWNGKEVWGAGGGGRVPSRGVKTEARLP